jgi:ribosomal protein S1
MSMEDLLLQTSQRVKGFKRGEVVKGKIVEVTSKTAYVDIKGKAEAVVSESEFELNKEYFKSLKPGTEVTGVVLVTENDAGQVILSLRKAAVESKWKAFEQAMSEDSVITVKGKAVTKGGLLVDADGVYGFVPSSQFGKALESNVSAVVGKPIQVKVIEVDQVQNRLVLSERAVSEAEEIEKRKRALEAVKIGGEYEGVVVGMVPFGAFVSVKVGKGEKAINVEGLVHISEISWEKIDEVSKALKEGETVMVQVIGIDEESGKLALSIKRLTSDPWLIVSKKYPNESKHKGIVTKVVPYGVLVKLERGIEGLIHASKLPAEMSFKDGDQVEVFVESVDLDKRRLSLGVVVKDTKGMIYK